MEGQIREIRLTQFSHGAGCGCKIAPDVLDRILRTSLTFPDNRNLLVGNDSRDDAAVYDLGSGEALISTTDFFMPIVDDPYEFGRIAAANAISDVYAMGGRPLLAIAILGWPVGKLEPEVAGLVIEGGRSICMEAGIPLAGGHSIDSPEPIFGLAVNGLVGKENIKRNNTARAGNKLFLTKPLGVGILTTAEKKGLLKPEHARLAAEQMMRLNKVGESLGAIPGVTAMTDVTGFGLGGHLTEMANGSGVSAVIYFDRLPLITDALFDYVGAGTVPGGTNRNWAAYGNGITFTGIQDVAFVKAILADPQTSGGLLVAVEDEAVDELEEVFRRYNLSQFSQPIGEFTMANPKYCIRVV